MVSWCEEHQNGVDHAYSIDMTDKRQREINVLVNTAVPAQQKTPERKALNGKLPTIREYINCNMAVARAQQANISSTCVDIFSHVLVWLFSS